MSRVIEIKRSITVGDLADKLELPAATLVAELFKHGVMTTLNERIDVDIATILVEELGLDIILKAKDVELPKIAITKDRKNPVVKSRPPIVAIMGHVDHGKTSLLDRLCGGSTVGSEAGGITQHIVAHQIEYKKRPITLLDTPGHAAFAAIREHGANLTDLAVIVIAADDGLKPQTLEAIRFAEKAKVKMVVAVNKIDKDESGINKVKQQLAENNVLTEGLGGDVLALPVSAKTGQGVDELMDAILLVTDLEDLKADYAGPATGLVIEARVQKGMGPTATVLVREGKLEQGDYIVAGAAFGRVKTLQSVDGRHIDGATASTPIDVCGLKSLPEFGDEFYVAESEKVAKDLANAFGAAKETVSSGMTSREILRLIKRKSSVSEHNVIVKADVQGSLTSILDSIRAMDTDEVATQIVSSGVGSLNESDIRAAKATGAVVYCFGVAIPASMKRMSTQQSVVLRPYSVIYELLDGIKESLEALLPPAVVELKLATLEIQGVFNTTKNKIICGGKVKKGKITLPAVAAVLRAGEEIATGLPISGIQKGPSEVKEVSVGEMCGLSLTTEDKVIIKEGDELYVSNRQVKKRKLQ